MRIKKTGAIVLCTLFLSGTLGSSRQLHAQPPPEPPAMPGSGPGGYDYPHAEALFNGPYWPETAPENDNFRYFIFEPSSPKPDFAPVVLFLHGFVATTPGTYFYWMQHIAKKGYIVVWVQYDAGGSALATYGMHAMATWRDALLRLESPFEDHVRPERDESGEPKTAVVGHSLGGYLAMEVAATAADGGFLNLWALHRPRALVLIEPGGWHVLPRPAMEHIPSDTLVLLVVGDEDDVNCKETAVNIWGYTPHIPAEQKDFLLVLSDSHGQPEQIANHYFTNTTGYADTAAIDGRDFYVPWKLSVGALNCAFRGEDCAYAFGNGALPQIDMGQWSDGVERAPMVWIQDPAEMDVSCTDVPVPPWGPPAEALAGMGQTQASGAASSLLNHSIPFVIPVLLVLLWKRRRTS